MWIAMMGSYSFNKILKFELLNTGFKIYRCCGEKALDILEEAKPSRNHDLKCAKDAEPLRTGLIQQIFKVLTAK